MTRIARRYRIARASRAMIRAVLPAVLLCTACSSGDSGPPPNSPLATPMALVVNQDDTSMTTIRLDGTGSPVISTLSLGPAQTDAVGGVTFSLGEWIFVTHTAGNRVAFIDPIGALTPILEDFLAGTDVPRIGQSPKRIYRDPLDKEVLWTMNEGADASLCQVIGPTSSVSVLHNSHIAVGGTKPRILTTACLWGTGEQRAVFVRPTPANPGITRQDVLVSSKDTGLLTVVLNDPGDTTTRYSRGGFMSLCDGTKQSCPPFALLANQSAPTALEWSSVTGRVYAYLSGYGTIVEINPATLAITRTVDLALGPFNTVTGRSFGMTSDGRFLFLVGEDLSDPAKVVGKFGAIDLTQPALSVTFFSIPQLDNIRPAQFRFTPDGKRLYLTQSNSLTGLATLPQAQNLINDVLLVFDPSTLPLAPMFLAQIPLPSSDVHGLDVWITGPQGAGSAKGVVVTNATPGVNGTVSLIDAASNTITTTIPVGRNPKQVTVYYYGLAASDNQAIPTW